MSVLCSKKQCHSAQRILEKSIICDIIRKTHHVPCSYSLNLFSVKQTACSLTAYPHEVKSLKCLRLKFLHLKYYQLNHFHIIS